MSEYARTLSELRTKAIRFWPAHLRVQVAEVSILPLLLRTQDKFISVLTLGDAAPDAWKRLVDQSPDLPANLFLKHLMVLSDLGWETLKKIVPLDPYFPGGQMHFVWRETSRTYQFRETLRSSRRPTSPPPISPQQLVTGIALMPKIEDLVTLLLHGATAIGDSFPDGYKEKCQIGSMIGETETLNKFVRENYLRVSTQLRGQSANSLGHFAQRYVKGKLTEALQGYEVRGGRIPGIMANDGVTETSFDVVIHAPNGRYFAIEVGFQETTNSVIERKAGQAMERARLLHENNCFIGYVLDGAGNMDYREPACRTICQFSDCTVAFSDAEIQHMANFIREMGAE